MSDYEVTHFGDAYEVGTRDGLIVGACSCGSGISFPDKGFGRAMAATWRTRHQDCATTKKERP